MKIGIDISQTAYMGTGVSNYLIHLVQEMVKEDKDNEYILFFSSLRKNFPFSIFHFPSNKNVTYKIFKFPAILLDLFWNKLHIFPIEWFIGDIDIFITSDWTEPPVIKAKKITILYDLIVYTHPEETDNKIIATQKRKLSWVVKESDKVLCISEATKKDAIEILKMPSQKLTVTYPGF